jgi:hypothetical protein
VLVTQSWVVTPCHSVHRSSSFQRSTAAYGVAEPALGGVAPPIGSTRTEPNPPTHGWPSAAPTSASSQPGSGTMSSWTQTKSSASVSARARCSPPDQPALKGTRSIARPSSNETAAVRRSTPSALLITETVKSCRDSCLRSASRQVVSRSGVPSVTTARLTLTPRWKVWNTPGKLP